MGQNKEIRRLEKSKSTLKNGLKVITPFSDNLSENEKEVLHLLTEEFFTIKQVSIRRQTSDKAVYQIVNRLVKKGYLDKQNFQALKKVPPCHLELEKEKVILKEWRYHNLHFVVKPFYFFPRYHKVRTEKGNYGINHREWVIKLHEDMVEIQLQALQDFSDVDKWVATKKAEDSFNKTLREVSNKYGFSVFKEGKANIRLVQEHLAQNPSEVANSRNGEYLAIRDIYDGKIWFMIDKSKSAEHEYTKSQRVLSDSEKIEPYFNDLLNKQPWKNSDLESRFMYLFNAVEKLSQENIETAKGIKMISKFLESQLPQDKKDSDIPQERPDYFG